MHGALMTGRKRKQGHRYPSGDVIREQQESAHDIAMRQPHRMDAPLSSKLDQRAETPFGRLNLIGAISGEEYRAGNRFARLSARYRAVIDAPSTSTKSNAGALEPKGAAPIIEDAKERKEQYLAALEALEGAGRTSAGAVALMTVHGEACPYGGFGPLVRGLRYLREHFELTDRVKSMYSVGK